MQPCPRDAPRKALCAASVGGMPRELELPGDGAIMRKDGDRSGIEPTRPASLSES
jgi:hypothetical protein